MLVCTGAVLIAVFGAIPEPAHNLDQLLDLLGRRAFVLWMIGQGILVSIIIVIAGCLARVHSATSNSRIRLLRGLAYGAISGILSAHSLLVAKSAVELLVRTIVDRKNQFNRWQSWACLLGLVFFALTQLYYLHRGLKLVSTSVLYPLVFCIYNIIAILDGLIYFHQTSLISVLRACLIALGTAILLSGVLALSWRLNDEQTQPAVAQSALAPGLGFVEDTDNESSDSLPLDEEAAISDSHEALLSNAPMTPTTKLDAVLGATRKVRKVRLQNTENQEIWDELAEATARSTPGSRSRSDNLSTPRNGTGDAADDDEADESTALLKNRRHRRRSTGFPGFQARPERAARRKSLEQKGFWKMQWWRRDTDKGPPRSRGAGGGGGGADEGAV